MAPLTIGSTLKLHSGNEIPILGFGVAASPKHLTTQSCLEALKIGYRHIDTAEVYGNEVEVKEAVSTSSIASKDVFIIVKVFTSGSDVAATYEKCMSSIQKIDGEDCGRVHQSIAYTQCISRSVWH